VTGADCSSVTKNTENQDAVNGSNVCKTLSFSSYEKADKGKDLQFFAGRGIFLLDKSLLMGDPHCSLCN